MPTLITGSSVVEAGELESSPVTAVLEGERLRFVNVETKLLLAAARLALRDAGLTDGAVDPEDVGVVVATRHAGLQDYVELFLAGLEHGRAHVSPARGPQTGLNAPASYLSIRLPAAGPNATLSSGAVGGIEALRYAVDALAGARAAAMLVCGVDVTPAVVRVSDGRPPSGGAAVVVLEDAAARAPSTQVRVGVVGVATAHAADDDVADARRRALRDALRGVQLAPDSVHVSVVRAEDHAEGLAAIAQLARAATSLWRRHVRVPVVVCACDDFGAGAALLVGTEARG